MTAEKQVERKVPHDGLAPGCPVHRRDDVWQVQDFASARSLLRHPDTAQAGFMADQARANRHFRPPVLYRDGAEHREHRRQTAKFFTPKRVDTAYRELMVRHADRQCAALRRRGEADLADVSFRLAVDVVGEIIGLTEAGPGMAKRLDAFFASPAEPGRRRPAVYLDKLRSTVNVLSFLHRDVRPSIKARRARRRDDLISHLIDDGCTDGDILGECVTFGAAGMITTREFILAAAWHLFGDPELRDRFTAGPESQRVAILHEILRVDPVISSVLRRTTASITLGDTVVPAGSLVDVGVAAVNIDPATVGDDPGQICPARQLPEGIPDAVLSFGDGPHRCPGAYIAVQETAIFLAKLFTMPGLRMTGTPEVKLRPEIQSYEIKGLRVRVDPA